MDFQISALPETAFTHLFDLSDAALAARNACRTVVTSSPGTPCRVSMEDAQIGETVILLNYMHQPENSPYQAAHAIYVRQNATQAQLAVNEVPPIIQSRLMSIRQFDESHMMIEADVAHGDQVANALSTAFENPQVAYIHLHIAKPGCFAALVHRG